MWILDELKKRQDDDRNLALIHREKSVTYAELWKKSEQIGAWLNAVLSTKAPVLIYGDKDIEIVEIMLAALKTGRAYIPIDVTFPPERVKKIAGITECEVLFNLSDVDLEFDVGEVRYLIPREQVAELKAPDGAAVPDESNWVEGDDNCYILFTSGSTGEPKGVQISKNNLLNFSGWFEKYAKIGGPVALNQPPYSFDLSVLPLYVFLPAGKTLFCVDKGMTADFGLLFRYLRNSNVSAWASTPAFIEMCVMSDSFDRMLLPKLEKIILIGETLTKKLVRLLWSRFPGVEVINAYGPTEGTFALSQCTINEEMMADEENELPIGYLLDDAKYEISGSDGKGELLVSSRSISKGYFNNPGATEKNFFRKDGDASPWYRTGDVVYEQNGMLYFCGRKDFQIKLNGYRIELDDISENINKIDGIANNVILPVYRDGKVVSLAAFVVLSRNLGMSSAKTGIYIRQRLAKLVPSYMVPKKIVILEKFPLNVNGKIDRKQLRETYLCSK